jgi:hypothetical protein
MRVAGCNIVVLGVLNASEALCFQGSCRLGWT